MFLRALITYYFGKDVQYSSMVYKTVLNIWNLLRSINAEINQYIWLYVCQSDLKHLRQCALNIFIPFNTRRQRRKSHNVAVNKKMYFYNCSTSRAKKRIAKSFLKHLKAIKPMVQSCPGRVLERHCAQGFEMAGKVVRGE